MRCRMVLLVLTVLSTVPAVARAQDFGVLESAETIDQGNFKIRANPMVIFGRHGEDSRLGVAVLVGYGFTHRFDAEGGVALYDGVTFFGGNGEFWLMRRRPFDFSVTVGLHARRGDQTFDATGLDLTFLPSKHIGTKLDLYAGLDIAIESVSDRFGGGRFKTAHVVPGVEYRLAPDLDLVAELGLGLNDDARHYISGGFAYYLR